VSATETIQHQEIDSFLSEWQQGDFVLGDYTLMYLDVLHGDDGILGESVPGLTVVTQTCDIVRQASTRPFVEMCPLVHVSTEHLDEIKRCMRPQYAYLHGAEDEHLVADLDRTMTVTKKSLFGATRHTGCITAIDSLKFASALARKRQRFAFPDNFTAAASKFRKNLIAKCSKNGDEGTALRSITEIRVTATPDWNAEAYEVAWDFILADGVSENERIRINNCVTTWMEKFSFCDKIMKGHVLVRFLQDMTAKEYNESCSLDLDHLSSSKE